MKISTVVMVGCGLLTLAPEAAAELVPNSQRYADRNPSAATGRSGNATLAVTALLGKDGAAIVDVTAGRVDGTTAGNLSMLQFKAYDHLEKIAWLKNVSGLTGSTHQSRFDGFLRGQPIQTQATIKDIDGQRADVVVTSGNVRLRPDLYVSSIAAPASQKTGLPTLISAVVSEINGDTGARANCVLTVNGVEADRAAGIWVDAYGTVTCAFTKVFDFVGTYTLSVSVRDVEPGDWDPANNAASASIEIANSGPAPFSWFAGARNVTSARSGKMESFYTEDSYLGHYSSFGYEWSDEGKAQECYVAGSSSAAVTFPITIQFTATADGLLIEDGRMEGVMPISSYDDGYYRTETYRHGNFTTPIQYYVSSFRYGTWERSQMHATRFAGDAVYYSRQYSSTWNQYEGQYYFYEVTRAGHNVTGQFWPMTETFSMTFSVTDAAARTWSASPDMVLSPVHTQFDNPYRCFPWVGFWGSGYNCMENHFSSDGYQGFASGFTQ